ncbi:MAG: ABC transporter permease [Stackebrandtia sp.]
MEHVPATPKRIFPKTTGLTALWRHRQPLRVLIQRDLAVKYQKSALGYLWSLIEPLGMACIYWFIFGLVFNRAGLPGDAMGYPLYVVSGIFAWMWVSSALSEATTSLVSQSSLITTMRVPREVFPVARVFARFTEFLAGFPILMLFVWLFGGQVGWHSFILVGALVLQVVLLTGISFILASINVLYRDVERFMRLIMRVMFYAAPVIYPLSKVMDALEKYDWAQYLYMANPFVTVMQLHRAAWDPGHFMPSAKMLYVSIGTGVFLLFFGRWLFHKLEPRVLKEL